MTAAKVSPNIQLGVFPNVFSNVEAGDISNIIPLGRLVTTRALAGFGLTSLGTLTSFPANTSRITDLGDTIEPAATNLALQSGAFSNAAWNVSSARPTIVTTNETAPDGTATAVRATVSSVNNRFAQGVTVTNNQPVTFTVWVKAAPSSSAVNVRLASNDGGAWNTGGDAVVALTSSWQRLTMEYQNSFGTGVTLLVGAVKSDSTNDATCYGDVLIWGGQFEANSTSPTSYIPTVTVPVTRAADSAVVRLGNVRRIVFTFSDGTTQTVTGLTPYSNYTIPTNLNKPIIARIMGYPV